ncbi:MAG: outer membrane protein assembly factor BamE [Hydrogenophaga sp.]|nr:outer membrane protein assembly factor BamE [Hydrogenophaga sp.]
MHHLTSPPSLPAERRRGRPVLLVALVLGALGGLSACTSVANLVTPYKIDIQQGNVVTREQAQALAPGMSRLQVRDVLGSPLLTSVFHADRWDYVFTFRRQGAAPQQRKLTVFFKDDVLERFEGDELPTEAEFVASLDVRRKAGKQPVLQATEEQLRAFQQRNATSQPSSVSEPAVAPARSYPPLETPGASQ